MRLDIYLNYAGNCEEAFRFYERELGARVTSIERHGAQPDADRLPPDWIGKVLHARMELGGTTVAGADIPGSQPMRSAYLSLRLDSPQEVERVYGLLADGGEIFMKLAETFFATHFAMLRDRFGTSWMLLMSKSDPADRSIDEDTRAAQMASS